MKTTSVVLGIASLVGVLAAPAAMPSPAGDQSAALLRLPRAAAAGQLGTYGHIRALTRKGARYELRFDPALSLSGVTANRAAVEDKVVEPGEPVPNDYYIRDESRKLLTYLVPAAARVTVLTNPGTGPRSVTVSVGELSQIVKGRNPKSRPLFGTRNNPGYWLLVDADRAISIDQQYQP